MKRAGLGILAFLISIAVFVSPALALEDMNGDYVVNVLDLVLSQNPKIVSGDTNADSKVDIIDLATVGLAYGSQPGDANWNPDADVANTIDEIDIFDLATVGLNFNKQFPEPVIDPIFSVSPASSDLKVGENITIDITIETIPADAEIYAAELKIYFDPAVLRVESVTEGDFLKKDGEVTSMMMCEIWQDLCPKIDNTLGKIEFANTRLGTTNGTTGSGTILTLIFSGKAAGSSYLNIDDILVSDPNLEPVTEITANNGSANVVISDPPSITSVSDDSDAGSPTNVGQDVTFTVGWTDPDSSQARFYACDSNNIDSAGCQGREFCSTSNSATNPQSCAYTTQQSDNSEEQYWVKACDNANVCSDLSGPHTFNVNHAPSIAVPDQSVDEDTPPPADWVDLWAYTQDQEDADNTLTFALTSQTNSALISCSLSGNQYINCNTPAQDQSGFSDLTVQATDPQGLSDTDTFRVTVNPLNDLPTQPGVDVTPDTPDTNDDLVCTVTSQSTDADEDEVSYSYAWYKDGSLQSAYNDQTTVPSSATARGEIWKCEVTPNDGIGDGPYGEDEVIIQNSPPTAPVVDVTPDSPLIADDLLCTVTTPSTDADGDEITYSYAWFKDGNLQAGLTTNTVPAANTAKNQVWNCKVTPNDGIANGAKGENQVVVGNTAPVASSLNIAPANPKTTNNLMASYIYSDADGDPESGSEIRWYKGEALQSAYNDLLTLPSSATAKDEEWHFTVKPKDGLSFGALKTSPIVTILNTPPGAPVVDVTPDSPLTTNNLVCSIASPSIDPDGDSIIYSYSWYKNDVQEGLTTNTVDSANTAKGETWKCIVTPNDGEADGPSDKDQVTIQNSLPTAPVVDVTPDSPLIADDLLCSIVTLSTDADDDSITYSYSWGKDGVLQEGLTTDTVDSALTAKNELWKCKVTPNDGIDDGPAGDDEVVVGNTAPAASNPAISPASPKTGDNLVASYDYFDADGDPESGSEIRWYKDTVLQPAHNDQKTVPSSATAKGQEWYFTVKPKDGLGFGALKTSPAVTILNTAPGAPVVDVTPDLPLTTNDLTCNIATPSQDADNDPITYSYSWGKDGVLQGELTTDTVDSSNTAKDQVWNCKVTPNDGTDNGPAASDEVTIQNSHPSIDSFIPASDPLMDEGQSQLFTITKSDPDGDAMTTTWYLDGNQVETGDSYTYNTDYDSQGFHTVGAVVSDGTISSAHYLTFTVRDNCTRTYLTAGNNIFSLPRNQQKAFNQFNTDCSVVFENERYDLAYYEPNDANISSENYRFVALNETLYPGQGYFVKVSGDCYIQMCDGAVETGDIGYLGQQLKTGWNLAGAPTYQTAFNAGTCQLFGVTGLMKYGYNVSSCNDVPGYNGGYSYCSLQGGINRCRCAVDYFEPGFGYWLRTKNDCQLA